MIFLSYMTVIYIMAFLTFKFSTTNNIIAFNSF